MSSSAKNLVWPQSFREAYCQKFNCPKEEFETRLFWQCLYRPTFPLAAFIYRSDPDYFKEDFDLLQDIADQTRPDIFIFDLNYYHGRIQREHRWWRRVGLIRISASRLLAVKNQLYATVQNSSATAQESSTTQEERTFMTASGT